LYLCHEVLNNVIKHAEATNLFCTLFVEGGSLVLRFRDDGRGFQIDDQPKGRRGLANIRARVQRLRGSVEMRSAPNEGTELAIRLPLGD
jgi:signal transduction histidine kinase